jgi:hypothetical protein
MTADNPRFRFVSCEFSGDSDMRCEDCPVGPDNEGEFRHTNREPGTYYQTPGCPYGSVTRVWKFGPEDVKNG